MSNAKIDALPAGVRKKLDELTKALEDALGDGLAGLLVHGSAARGEYREGQSDVDLMLVLTDASRERLEAIENALVLARYAAKIEAMILTVDEIPRAADVFPLLYDDIRRCHVLLAGTDPFSSLTISDRHRRLRVEQELREAQIRMRRALTDAQGARGAIAGAVRRKVRQIRGPLRALLALKGHDVGDDHDLVMAKAASLYGVDLASFKKIDEAPDAAYDALAKLLAAAVEDVDRMEDGGAA